MFGFAHFVLWSAVLASCGMATVALFHTFQSIWGWWGVAAAAVMVCFIIIGIIKAAE